MGLLREGPEVPFMQRLLTAPEAAEFLGIGLNTLYIWARAGRIPYFKLAHNAIRFDADELRAWVEQSRRGPLVAAT